MRVYTVLVNIFLDTQISRISPVFKDVQDLENDDNKFEAFRGPVGTLLTVFKDFPS